MAESMEMAKKYLKEVKHDFRTGLDLEYIVYREKDRYNCLEIFCYILILILYYAILAAYYALWHWAYINYTVKAFIAVVVCAGTLWIIWFSFAVSNYKVKIAEEKAEEDRIQLEIQLKEDEKNKKLEEVRQKINSNNKNDNLQAGFNIEFPLESAGRYETGARILTDKSDN
jgi:hypothetical protein